MLLIKSLEKNKTRKLANDRRAADAKEVSNFNDMLSRDGLTPDRVLHFFAIHFAFDSSNSRIFLKSPELPQGVLLNFKDIINYELIENGQVIHNGSAGKAVAGALLFGVAGAVVGSTMHSSADICTFMQLRLTINNISTPSILITLIAPPGIIRNSQYYYDALGFIKEVIATLDVIKNQQR
jgi:hypothetical protein